MIFFGKTFNGAFESKAHSWSVAEDGLTVGGKKYSYGSIPVGLYLEKVPISALYTGVIRVCLPGDNKERKMCFKYSEKATALAALEYANEMIALAHYDASSLEDAAGDAPQDTAPASAADELRKFKELLDEGIITQEEFDQKKKQLLGL